MVESCRKLSTAETTIQDVLRILDETRASFVLLLCHQNADPDALCSAYAFQRLLEHLAPSIVVEIGAGEGISKLSKHILNHLPITITTKPSVENAGVIVLLDTNTTQQLGELAETVTKSSAPIIVIDHHAPHPDTLEKAKLSITNEDSPSTCEMIYQFFKQFNIQPSVNEAQALFLGIAFDTRHFVLANASTLKTISELCDFGVNPQVTLELLTLPMDASERLARMKACRRAKLVKLGSWIIAFSHVSAFQASAARALVDLGAHAAAVAGQRDDNVEVSFRCTREFVKGTGIHLGKDLAKPLGELLQNGMGGGHAAAAGANGVGDTETALKHCLNLFKEKLAKAE
jgi:bifunctional oligoribonuclease and PAP phosphatase NrnA